jgi:hypothetical protein
MVLWLAWLEKNAYTNSLKGILVQMLETEQC